MQIRHSLAILSGMLVLVPALLINVWTYNQSLNSEYEEVAERHLLLARNLGVALERYQKDTRAVFNDISRRMTLDDPSDTLAPLIADLGFHDISLVNLNDSKVKYCLATYTGPKPKVMNFTLLETAKAIAVKGKTRFSHVIAAPDGTNVILMVRRFGDNIAIGKLKTNYFIELAGNISFGKKGHAAIVDQKGNIIAHPLASWAKARKNIADVSIVKRMMNGETGIDSFYSPAQKGNMVAGFTTVAKAGWGIMIPQPITELTEKASANWKASSYIIFASFTFAVLLSIWLSVRSTRPLTQLIETKNQLTSPEEQGTVSEPTSWFIPREIKQLFATHNSMITRLRDRQIEVFRMAYSDMVTGLPTRAAFNKLTTQALEGKTPEKNRYLLIFLDLDNFKGINDTMGHETGDTTLSILSKQFADSISNYTNSKVITSLLDENGQPIDDIEENSIIARVGGDEFVGFVPWNGDDSEIPSFLLDLNDSISTPFIIAGIEISIHSSIGAAIYGKDGDTIGELTRKADIAMYWAKKAGKNCVRLYDKSVGEQTPAEIQRNVSLAIKNKEMVLYYQPKIMVSSGATEGVEALIRWNHPEKGILAPGFFLPAIEDRQIAEQLDEWVIVAAAQQIRTWQDMGRNISVAINISNHLLVSQYFLPNLLSTIEQIGIPPHLLEIEITEETAMSSHTRAMQVISALKENGFTVSLDDFGKGYSNLARLASLDIDTIKLDLSLVHGITEDERKRTIVSSALDLSRKLGCKTVAEGIETIEQAGLVSKMGCEILQGYLFAKPMSVRDLDIWMLRRIKDIDIAKIASKRNSDAAGKPHLSKISGS